MPYLNNLPIMPKEARTSMSFSASATVAPYPQAAGGNQRNAAIWTTADDEILLRARASGLNWQPIASKNFPNKTANACRKRHERLIERRHVDDWDNQKLELLAQEYLACRKEMWETLAARIGERWNVVEAKCMEKGLKNLQTTARTAQRKATADQRQAFCEDRGISDHNSDSGIVLCSGSEPDMDVDESAPPSRHGASASWSESHSRQQHHERQKHLQQEHMRSRSLPLPLPLPQYQPPLPRTSKAQQGHSVAGASAVGNLGALSYERSSYSVQRYSPETQHRLSIQSVLSPAEPPKPGSSGSQGAYDYDAREGLYR
ncbi:hypothetical protein Q7P37_007168 [Cladosporium fusiforme]